MNKQLINHKLRVLIVLIAWGLMSGLVVACDKPELHCDEMLTLDEVTQVLEQHAETVEKIEAINSCVRVWVNDQTCPGKAYVLISHCGRRDRQAIEEIIAETGIFENVFYWLVNI